MNDDYRGLVQELAGDLSDYERRMADYYFSCGIPAITCALQIGSIRRETAEAARDGS